MQNENWQKSSTNHGNVSKTSTAFSALNSILSPFSSSQTAADSRFTMAKLSLLYSFSVCFFFVFHAQAVQLSPRQSQCRIENIDAIEPTRTVRSEAGVTELWDENDNQLECAGVAIIRHTIQSRGLLLPHYHNAPKITYVVQGQLILNCSFHSYISEVK